MNRHFAPRALYVLLILSFALVAVPPAAAAPDAPMATTVFSESMYDGTGSVTGTQTIAYFETGNYFQNDALTMTGTGDMRMTTVSTGYTGASGSYNAFLTNTTAGKYFQIADINTTGYTNLTLSFGVWKSAITETGSTFTVAVSSDETNWTTLTVPALPTGTGTVAWYYRTASGAIPATSTLFVRFTNTGTATQFRIDDVLLVGDLAGDAAPSVLSTTPANGTTVASNATVSVTFSEPVTFSGPISIVCTNSGTQSVTPAATADPAIWNLPYSGFAPSLGDSCSITILATQIADTDTNDPPNNMTADFTWSFAVDAAPSVTSTTPADLATDVPVGADLSVTFSEGVTVNTIDSFFDIYCEVSGVPTLQPAAGSGGPTVFTINPTADLPAGSNCTVTIKAAQVADQDAIDPPDAMAADKVFTFQTAAADAAPYVASTSPGDGATGVAVDAAVSVTFSEAVTFNNTVDISCTSSKVQTVTPTGGPTTWTLPHTPFHNSENCIVMIGPADVSDVDTNDPPDFMAEAYGWDFNTVAAPVATPPVINEFSASTTGTDVEYVEIFGDPTTDYSAYTILEIEGDTATPVSPIGTVDEVIALGTTDANGLYLVNLAANALENGTVSLLLVLNFTGALNNDLDTNNDGIFDVTPWTALVDTVAVNDGGAGDITYGAPTLGVAYDGQPFAPGGASRIPDGTDTDTAADWVRNDFDLAGIPGKAGTPVYGEAYNTPGALNQVVLPKLVINEIDYDQPGTDAAEYVEIRNNESVAVPLDSVALELVNGSGGGALLYKTIDLPAVSLAAGDYFVVCANTANVANCDLDVTPDTDLIQNGAPDAVGLRFNGNLIDAVSYEGNTGAPYTEGSGTGLVDTAASATEGISRCPDGSDTNVNNVDLLLRPITPGAANNCIVDAPPQVSTTNPSSGATGVSTGTSITINFNEIVDVAAGAFTVECPVGTPVSFTANPTLPAGDISSVVLTPDSPLPISTVCTVTAIATAITDNDGTVDQLDGDKNGVGGDNFVFTFTTAAVDPCTLPATLISAIQGSGAASPYAGNGTPYTLQGIVVGDYEQAGLSGYFVQEEDGDADGNPATSEGVFVYDNNATSEVSLGDKVRVTGTVSEYFTLTEVTTSGSPIICNSGNSVTPASVSLPVAALADLEPYEGMKVTFPQTLTVTDNYDLGRYGQLTLSANGKLWQFTHQNAPSVSGYAAHLAAIALRSIVMDDGSSTQNPATIFYPGTGLTASNTVRVDDTVAGLTGVLDYRFDFYRIQPVGQVNFTAANPRPTAPPAVGGTLKVASFNTLNFFTTIDTTGGTSTGICGPSGNQNCRGADNADEFTKQRAKLVAAICGLNADVLGLMELENPYSGNDPFPSDGITDYVLQNLVGALNSVCPGYAFIDNTGAGTDAIRQGLIYKPGVVTPVGTTAILNSTAFINGGDATARNRPALTQAFQVNAGGEQFIVSVNHLKSKGSACTAPDLLDGQANCAVVRTNAAIALTTWLATNPTGTGDPDILIMGDLNSYAKENPITAFVNAGYTDLINWTVGSAGYGYAFDGMMGYLDHALGSSALLAQVTAADEWHINSPEPYALDYDTQFKSPAQMISLYNPDPYRSTDHDAVLVGLGLGLNPDRGDLDASYGQAWHTGQGVVWKLGALWTGEASSTPGSDNPSDDGVVRNYSESWNDTRGEVNVTVTGAAGHWACLNAWLDYSDGSAVAGTPETPNGLFDTNEHVVNNLPIQAGAGQLVTWPLELGVINDTATYNMRFRLAPAPNPAVASCSGVTLSSTDVAYGGEVEDYAFTAGPLAVDLAGFTAAAGAEGVTLAWETVSETDNAGFNVYRAGSVADRPEQEWVKLNDALIAAAAPGSSEGHSYAFTDATAAQGATYWYALEDVALDGTLTRHAPVSVTVAQPNAVGLAGFGAAPVAGAMPALAGLAALALAALAGVAARRRR